NEVNISMGIPLKTSQLYSFLLNWLEIQDYWNASRNEDQAQHGFPKKLLDNFYKHPYCRNIHLGLESEPSRFTTREILFSESELSTDFEKLYFKIPRDGVQVLENLIDWLETTFDLLLNHPEFSEIERVLNQRLMEVLRALLESIRIV